MTAAQSKSYQSIKVEHPDAEDAGSHISSDEVRPESSFKTKGLVFVTALCATVLLGAVSFSRTDEFANVNSPSGGLSPNVDEAFLLMPDEEEDEDFLDFPISGFTGLPPDQKCVSPAGVLVGQAGTVNIEPRNSFAGISFERKGFNCDCSFVSSVLQFLSTVIASIFVSLSQRYKLMKPNVFLNRPP